MPQLYVFALDRATAARKLAKRRAGTRRPNDGPGGTMPSTIMTSKRFGNHYRTMAARDLCTRCGACQFEEALKKDERGRYVKGDWKQALLHRNDPTRENEPIARQNVNSWLKNVPCVVLAKGTELFHVSATSNWVRTTLVGANNQDDGYSFFTLRAHGFANLHGSHFQLRVQLRLREDLHAFICPTYSFDTYRVGAQQFSNRNSRPQLVKSTPDKGGGLVSTIREAWPGGYRPRAIIGGSECEIIIHSSLIPILTETVGAATSTDDFQTRQIVHFGDLPASRPQATPVTFTPPAGNWMGPSHSDERRAERVDRACQGAAAVQPESIALLGP